MASVGQGLHQSGYVNAVAEIVGALITAYEAQVPINLSKIKGEMARKHKLDIDEYLLPHNQLYFRLAYIPKLVDIIAAVPPNYKGEFVLVTCFVYSKILDKPNSCPM